MKRLNPQIISLIILLGIFIIPETIHAQSVFGNFIKCGNELQPECGFGDLVVLVQDVITGLIELATLITTGVFAYAGFKLITSGGNPSVKEDAKKMLWKTIQGYLWILVAWTLVYTITSVLLNDGYSLLGNPR